MHIELKHCDVRSRRETDADSLPFYTKQIGIS